MAPADEDPWPPLSLESWGETYHALHMWTQIVGKVRLDMRADPDPRARLLEFLQSTYEAAADLGAWERNALER